MSAVTATSGSAVKKTRKRKKKGNNYYFNQGTEDAIILYNKTESPFEKNKIYNEHIRAAFDKLAEDIIHTFKFYHTEVENLEHLQHEIIVFLLSKIHLFDPSSTTFVKHFISRVATAERNDYSQQAFLAGYNNVTAAIDGVQFSMSSGDIDSGTIEMYGIN